jgi:leucyl aminopeptidase
MLNIIFENAIKNGNIVVFVNSAGKILSNKLSKDNFALLQGVIESEGFKGEAGKVISTYVNPSTKIYLAGVSQQADSDEDHINTFDIGGAIARAISKDKANTNILFDDDSLDDQTIQILEGLVLASYKFDIYKTTGDNKPSDDKPSSVTVVHKNLDKLKFIWEDRQKVCEAVYQARDYQNEPANVLYPVAYAKRIQASLEPLGIKVTILGEEQMQDLAMNALLGVGQGSAFESQCVIMEYYGDNSNVDDGVLAFVGQGVTVDTGGISIKPSAGVGEMKYDMGGSAVVVGTMQALAATKAKANVVAIVGLAENMPSDKAQRPGDIITSMSGQTIEVLNTDAEGRLVLADCLTYIQRNFKVNAIVDFATLTGAVVVALGETRAAVYSNDKQLKDQLLASSRDVDEKLWHMPLGQEYDKAIDSDWADMANISKIRGGGSITAAQFLKRFVENDTPWAHLDIAGVTWNKTPRSYLPKGTTAFGVRLSQRFVEIYNNTTAEPAS